MKFHYVLVLIILFSCKNNEENKIKSDKEIEYKHAIFIVEDNNENITTSIYRDVNLDNLTLTNHFYTSKSADTITIDVQKGTQLYFTTKNNYRDTLFVKNGDTIRINLKNNKNNINASAFNKPLLFKKNKKIDALIERYITISTKFPLEIQPTDFEKIEPIYGRKVDFLKIKNEPDTINKLVDLIEKDIKSGFNFFDSISGKNTNKKEFINQAKENFKYKKFRQLITLHELSKNKNAKNLLSSTIFINENLCETNNAYSIMHIFINSIILDNERISMGHKQITDYQKAFSLLPDYFTADNLQFAQIVCIQSAIDEIQNKERVEKLINSYEKTKTNSKLDPFIEKVKEDYNLKDASKSVENQIELKFSDGSPITLNELIAKNSNKIVYVDFWASWCAPCRQAMPDSRILHEKYKDKVSFIYISIDESKDAWQKANTKELLDPKYSLLATNYPSAKFYDKHQLKTIPRYMIYLDGKLVNSDAPGPNSNEISKELDKHLAAN